MILVEVIRQNILMNIVIVVLMNLEINFLLYSLCAKTIIVRIASLKSGAITIGIFCRLRNLPQKALFMRIFSVVQVVCPGDFIGLAFE